MSLATRLKSLREEHDMTQAQVGEIICVSRSTVSGYETKGRQPSHEKLIILAELFDVSMDYLIGGDSDNFEQKSSSFATEQEFDKQFISVYNSLSHDSKEEAYKYLCYLRYCEKK